MIRRIVAIVLFVLTFLPSSTMGALAASTVRAEPERAMAPAHQPESHRLVLPDAGPPVDAFDCGSLWSTGFPRTGTGLSYCLDYADEGISGNNYRVVYPAEWSATAGWGTPYLESAVQAIRDSIAVYSGLGTVGSVTVVFALEQADGAATSGADEALVEPYSDEPCAVVLYPLGGLSGPDDFKQIVAHELFHCFQDWNFVEGAGFEYATDGWWLDGSADYFSNVVYPTTNAEWQWIADFDAQSETSPITQFSYAASFFFQYLGNTIGDAQIIDLLATLPVKGSEADHQAALRAWSGMDDLFQGFAESYLDGTLMDTSGAAIPFAPTYPPTVSFNASGTLEAKVDPFVVRRRQLSFDPSMSYRISLEETSGDSLHGFRAEGGTWGLAPVAVDCGDGRAWYSVFTTVGEEGVASSPATVTATVDASDECDEASTDSCLQGNWVVTDYNAFMQAALATAGATGITFEGASGGMAFTFSPTTITYSASDFELRGSASAAGVMVEVAVRISGTATATYEVTEPGTIAIVEVDPGSFTIEAETFVGGGSAGVMPMDPLDWIFFASPTYGYTCSDATLGLTIPPAASPVVLDRG